MQQIGVGIIGTGFMGKAHAFAYRAAPGIFPLRLDPVLEMVSSRGEAAARDAAGQLDFRRFTNDWRELVADPAIGIVAITTPNVVHREIALAAIANGKHVHCEKPIAPDAEDARVMMEAAEARGIVTQVGYNYIMNPLLALARDMVAAGELGEITNFRGVHAEDYMAAPTIPYDWRVDQSGGGGAIADIGSHIIGMARYLLGDIADVIATLETVISERPVAKGSSENRKVLVDDIARLTVRFARGCGGSIDVDWAATGRKMQLGFELTGSKGSLVFTQERLNELLYYKAGLERRHHGFTRIEMNASHYPYGLFCPAPGHQLGFNDLKTIEVARFLGAIAGEKSDGPDFREAWEIQKVIDTAIRSSRERRWLKVA
ncbi:MAG: Gfo/Idh/MocA family protein [Parvibaculaceae bacterium]